MYTSKENNFVTYFTLVVFDPNLPTPNVQGVIVIFSMLDLMAFKVFVDFDVFTTRYFAVVIV